MGTQTRQLCAHEYGTWNRRTKPREHSSRPLRWICGSPCAAPSRSGPQPRLPGASGAQTCCGISRGLCSPYSSVQTHSRSRSRPRAGEAGCGTLGKGSSAGTCYQHACLLSSFNSKPMQESGGRPARQPQPGAPRQPRVAEAVTDRVGQGAVERGSRGVRRLSLKALRAFAGMTAGEANRIDIKYCALYSLFYTVKKNLLTNILQSLTLRPLH